MGKYISNVLVSGDPAEHPAAQFWRALGPRAAEPESIVILKERRAGKPGKQGKSAVYRLTNADSAGGNVVAKRCPEETASIERTIYEDMLPHLPVSALRYLGSVQEPRGGMWWLFLEEATGEAFEPQVEAHGAAAARWLGLLHTAAASLDGTARLPDRGAAHYLDVLRGARHMMRGCLDNPAVGRGDAFLVEELAARLDGVESRWSDVIRICGGVPSTLVHGDFVTKNVLMRPGPDGPAPLPFDWESAGWGVPAADLELVELEAYGSVVRRSWSGLDPGALAALRAAGILFRCVASIAWACAALSDSWVERPMRRLRSYLPRLQAATWDLGW